MSEYEIGKEMADLQFRVSQLEQVVRHLTAPEEKADAEQKPQQR